MVEKNLEIILLEFVRLQMREFQMSQQLRNDFAFEMDSLVVEILENKIIIKKELNQMNIFLLNPFQQKMPQSFLPCIENENIIINTAATPANIICPRRFSKIYFDIE